MVSEPPTHPRSAHECGSGSFSPSASLLAPSRPRPVGRCRSQQLRWRGRGAGDTDVSRTRTSFSAPMEARSEDGGGAVGRGDRVSSFPSLPQSGLYVSSTRFFLPLPIPSGSEGPAHTPSRLRNCGVGGEAESSGSHFVCGTCSSLSPRGKGFTLGLDLWASEIAFWT